jgi:prevent-host-death family protein
MAEKYSIAEARHNLAAIVHALEQKDYIELTRRGEPVAVLLSLRAYRRLAAPKTDFWEAYDEFRQTTRLVDLGIEPEVFEDVRATTPGREVDW